MVAIQTTPMSEIAVAVAELPTSAQLEVLHFALFLKTQLANEAWDAALESTTPEQAARIRARIASQRAKTTPMFNELGKVAPPNPA
jgi:hypothetical protein